MITQRMNQCYDCGRLMRKRDCDYCDKQKTCRPAPRIKVYRTRN